MNIEKVVKAFADNQPQTQMSKLESEILIKFLMSDNPEFKKEISLVDKTSEVYVHFKPIIESTTIKIFLSRLSFLTTHSITFDALIILSQYMESPGNSIMYLYYMNSKLKPNTLITLNVISMDLFPWGFFSQEQLNLIWSIQKVKREDIDKDIDICHGAQDNILDYNKTWGI